MTNKSRFLILLVALLWIPSLVLINTVSMAHAQERKTLFDLLFGPKQSAPQAIPKNNNQPMRRKPVNKAPQKTKPIAVTSIVTPQIEKSPDAKKILFIGDFVASAMSDGLSELYADNSNFRIIKRTDGSSGLVREDHYNWHDNISKIVAEENADIIIFVIGANDRQSIKINKKTLEFNSEDWNKIYQERVALIAKDLEATQKPWLWVGLPSFGKLQLHQSSGRFNAYYNAAIGNTNGQFVDIWSGFVDDKGSFALSGYDMNGQTARLRTNDGIAFTPAGRQKLAFYVKAAIEAIFNEQSVPSLLDQGNEHIEVINAPQVPNAQSLEVVAPRKKIERIPPTNLTDFSKNSTELSGNTKSGSPIAKKQREAYEEQRGRADYFAAP
ncbi:DUF459 domain-containing protein [Bartonella sp. HY329]|uniref:SGNH/GDSL hydrolase family protein n=1 Tax=unclassified Bartonella TaxID=2645622 RepID=UPI0021C82470|nr:MULTISPECIES: SGNH family hydrolase [unclassified Bartonella]UXM95318.1 DUF459 domain-containing protein [Bartonella sp. HY329]UXN09643.1 DUF459 domain-containing protein [Bartonella sp. HY328]